MAEVYSFRSLPPGVREEAEARGVVVRRTLTDMRTRVMPRHRPMDIDHWERTRGPEVIRLVTQAQAENAALVDRTFNLTLLAQGYMTEPIGEIRPAAFAGVMPDGDPLDLIPQAVANRVRERLATGAEPLQAWQAGGKLLATIVQTALSDSQRMAKMVAGFARPRTLYVRMLRPPSCSRCTVLAGKRGFWDKPFQRHPGCDCTQVPVPDWSQDTFEGPAFDPVAAFEELPASEQDRLFTKAGAEAIRSGADIAQVVNSRSGMSHVGDSYTRVGSTARGKAVQYFVGEDGKLRKQVNYRRLSVPKIVEMTEGNPDGRIALLYRHGYLREVAPGKSTQQVTAALPDSKVSHSYSKRVKTTEAELNRRVVRSFRYAERAHGGRDALPSPVVRLMTRDRHGVPAELSNIRGTSFLNESVIEINGTMQGQELTILHELGHNIDWQTRGQKPEAFSELLSRIRASAAIRGLENEKLENRSEVRYKDYLLSDAEIFARAYAQWVAVRSRSPRLNGVVAQHRGGTGLNRYMQWEDEDFDTHVVPAMDEYFAEA